jgi:GMP synthase-like glutamine amidotransferase
MKIAILICDDVLDKFQPRFGHYRDMIRKMFAFLDGPFEFADFDCRQGHYPKNIHDHDFYITTGSKASVYDNKPWIQELLQFVQMLDSHQKKLIGICFGHQLIAMARQGMVEKSTRGWGVGVAVNRIIAAPDWMSEKKTDLNIVVSHQDQVTALPADALVIAESDFCPFFMVQWSSHFLSIQGHPEWNREYSRTLLHERRTIIPAERVEAGLDSLSIDPDNQLFTRWIVDFVAY